jgi:hypothetical protein
MARLARELQTSVPPLLMSLLLVSLLLVSLQLASRQSALLLSASPPLASPLMVLLAPQAALAPVHAQIRIPAPVERPQRCPRRSSRCRSTRPARSRR